MNKSTRRLVAGGVTAGSLMLGAAGLVIGAGVAKAEPAAFLQDAHYVACVAQGGLHNTVGPAMAAAFGRALAREILSGISVGDEQQWVYLHTPAAVSRLDANVLVNCATRTYLGYGPDNTATSA